VSAVDVVAKTSIGHSSTVQHRCCSWSKAMSQLMATLSPKTKHPNFARDDRGKYQRPFVPALSSRRIDECQFRAPGRISKYLAVTHDLYRTLLTFPACAL
jgi:hypothetical protein